MAHEAPTGTVQPFEHVDEDEYVVHVYETLFDDHPDERNYHGSSTNLDDESWTSRGLWTELRFEFKAQSHQLYDG